jgi:hypothetical protein
MTFVLEKQTTARLPITETARELPTTRRGIKSNLAHTLHEFDNFSNKNKQHEQDSNKKL